MYGHEPNPPVQEEDFYSIPGGMEAVVEFLWVSDTCTGSLVYLFLKMRGEQSFSIGLVCNFLKVYASIFDFLQ